MRQGPLSLLLCLLLSPFALGEEPVASTPLSLHAGSQITELTQRLQESERLREVLTRQLHNADSERESAQLARLRQENQRLKLALKEFQAKPAERLITDQQQWFLIGGAVALLAALCGIFACGGHRKRRQWLN
ncbi:translation initiation factor 2 [Pseudomonas sp. GD03860]|uniref:translation initiation factor 2 n=1 Tax=Pseudomonas TaxID=286 RepID=UPI0023641E46|nr:MULTISPECIES: translation initiation factor 2 [Pseudomonas]MDD2060859.1 translation initiation factor 2 [Pseudomonas putida]MDH0638341.1 translation initiation factor 2 [Pseudomonas sp. GD03860]